MTRRAKFCVIGTGAGGGMLAYCLAMAGEDVLVINPGSLPAQSEFQNEMSLEQQGHFGIHPDTRFPVKPEIGLVHPLFADAADKSSVFSLKDGFEHYQINHVNGLLNLWNGVCLRYSEDDFANRISYNDQCVWPITYNELAPHYSAVEQLAHVVGNKDRLKQFPDGTFMPPRGMRQRDRIFLKGNAKLFGPDLHYFAARKAVDLRADSGQKCVACGNCARGCQSGSIYKFSTHLLPQIRTRPNFRLLDHTRAVKIVPAAAENSGELTISEIIAIDEKTGQSVHIQANITILCAGAIESPRIILNSFNHDKTKTHQVGLYLQDSPRVLMGSSLFHLWFKPITEDCGYGDHILIGGQCTDQGHPFPFVAHVWSEFVKNPRYLSNLQSIPYFLRPMIARQIYKSILVLFFQGHAVPRLENRVVLTGIKDRFMQNQVQIVYESAQKEVENKLYFTALARKMLKNASGYITAEVPSPPGSGIHYVGTCRMGPGPDKGVVDKDLRYFGAKNFYVCDGSVIPVLSEKHSTLTIMALAHRLGEHLIERYK